MNNKKLNKRTTDNRIYKATRDCKFSERDCYYCQPHCGCNAYYEKWKWNRNKRSWKYYRKTQYRIVETTQDNLELFFMYLLMYISFNV